MSAATMSVLKFHHSTIGKKVIMAVTGLIWIGYLLGHMYGNLKLFTGPEHFNEYAHGLRTLGAPVFGYAHLLTIVRIGLIVSFFAHVWAAITLGVRNRSARSTSYIQHKKLRTTQVSLTMIYGGVAVLLFVLYHLLHITLGVPGVHPNFDGSDAYHNVVYGFQSQGYIPVVIYLLALVTVGLHLFHGTWSVFQTLGLINKSYSPALRIVAIALALIIPLGFASVPIAIMLGFVS